MAPKGIVNESEQYGDILRGEFMDTYKNLTLKSLLLLKYATEFCGEVPFLVKSDDDILINVPYLARVLQTQNNTRSIIGCVNVNPPVRRTGKWGMSRADFPSERYPKYVRGGAYVLPVPLARELLEASKYFKLFPWEDVYVNGILAKAVKANHTVMNDKFDFHPKRAPNYCDVILETKILTLKAKPKVLTKIWEKLNKKSDKDFKNCKTLNPRRKSENIKTNGA